MLAARRGERAFGVYWVAAYEMCWKICLLGEFVDCCYLAAGPTYERDREGGSALRAVRVSGISGMSE